ncbi:class I SAM-dependent methyltransferase [Pedobacter sp. ASV1-7]|uniref:class I SAM-dependent methyltransferase n=1 Tax=Pedobacter sp. ASV1-7 TaxID=3145237 RepID=UPI0032E8B8B3
MDKVTGTVNESYNNFYKGNSLDWRMLCAKTKAQNLVEVCKGKNFEKVLEVGAGDGSILYYLNEWNFSPELYALEISSSGVEQIKNRNLKNLKEVQTFDGYKIPYPDNSFDLIILAHVLEHVEHERMLIRELKRVAKHIVIEVPLDYRFGVDKRIKHFLAYGHINMYTPTLIRYLLDSEGLEIKSDKASLIPTETTKYNEFVNKKKKRSLVITLKIEIEFFIKKLLGRLLGKNQKEKFANAYTVLTEKSNKKLEIF